MVHRFFVGVILFLLRGALLGNRVKGDCYHPNLYDPGRDQ
jgi:hypothetical protein